MTKTANDNITLGASEDMIQPFQLDISNFRGRAVRLDSVLNDIIDAHNYPTPISYILSQFLTMTTMLGGMLKFDGIFTVQASSKGIIKTLVCDMTTTTTTSGAGAGTNEDSDNKSALRGYAAFDADAVNGLSEDPKDWTIKNLFGDGHLAFTIDQKMSDRYQGIVALTGDTLIECVEHYFSQSEQIQTFAKMATHENDGKWMSSAIMVQKLPEDQKIQAIDQDDWRRTQALLNSCKDEELLDKALPINDLLYRLFHEEGVIVFPPIPLSKECRCSEDRVINVLMSLSDEERAASFNEKGIIEMTCEFCSRQYDLNKDDLK